MVMKLILDAIQKYNGGKENDKNTKKIHIFYSDHRKDEGLNHQSL